MKSRFPKTLKADPGATKVLEAFLETKVPRHKGKTIGGCLQQHPEWDSQHMANILGGAVKALHDYCIRKESLPDFRDLADDLRKMRSLSKKVLSLNLPPDVLNPFAQRAMRQLTELLPDDIRTARNIASRREATVTERDHHWLRSFVCNLLNIVGVSVSEHALDKMISEMAKKLNAPKSRCSVAALHIARYRRRKA